MPEGNPIHPSLGTWRRRTASGAVLTAMALGLREATARRSADEAS